MQLHFWQDHSNFGDMLNHDFWDVWFPNFREYCPDDHLMGIGSLVHRAFIGDKSPMHIFGAGAGYGDVPTLEQQEQLRCHFVRGPLTARVLGLDDVPFISDPAIMLPLMEEYTKEGEAEANDNVLYVPHWQSCVYGSFADHCKDANVGYVSPTEQVHHVVARIANATLVIAEAMHAAIIADAYGVPWVPVAVAPFSLGFKWMDWCASVDLDYAPIARPYSCVQEKIYASIASNGAKLSVADHNHADAIFEQWYDAQQHGTLTAPSVSAKIRKKFIKNMLLPALDHSCPQRINTALNCRHRDAFVQWLMQVRRAEGVMSARTIMKRKQYQIAECFDAFTRDHLT